MIAKEELEIKRGEIFWVDQEVNIESRIEGKGRPYIIISNNFANKHSSVLTGIPLTSNLNKKDLPTHCYVTIRNIYNNTNRKNMALCEQITSIPKEKIKRFLTALTKTELNKVEDCIKIQIGLKRR